MSILSGMGALLGGVSGMAGANTGYQSGSQTGTNSQSSNSSTTNNFTAPQQLLQGSTGQALQGFITNGPNLTPALTSGTDNINQTYKGIGDRLQQSLASRGFGNSGASGTAALQTELGRGGAVGNLQSSLEAQAQQQQLQALGLATNFGFAAPSTTTSGSSVGNTAGSYSGQYTNPSSILGSGLSGGFGGLLAGLNASSGLPSWMTSIPSFGSGTKDYSSQGLLP